MNGSLRCLLSMGPMILTMGLATLILLTSDVTVIIPVFLRLIMLKLRSSLPLPCSAISDEARIQDPLESYELSNIMCPFPTDGFPTDGHMKLTMNLLRLLLCDVVVRTTVLISGMVVVANVLMVLKLLTEQLPLLSVLRRTRLMTVVL